ncbi:MAG TPA: 50S ribosomal protein L19 [Kiritimatiellia bacterium]|jgi:large subunit ribosomal protein L19
MVTSVISKIGEETRKSRKVPEFHVGDQVKVFVKIREGDKERVQLFSGTVIARDGHGATETFTVRRISYGEGVERVFPIYSPVIDRLEVERPGRVRRAKLYYIRGRSGKKARIREEEAREEGASPASTASAPAPAVANASA